MNILTLFRKFIGDHGEFGNKGTKGSKGLAGPPGLYRWRILAIFRIFFFIDVHFSHLKSTYVIYIEYIRYIHQAMTNVIGDEFQRLLYWFFVWTIFYCIYYDHRKKCARTKRKRWRKRRNWLSGITRHSRRNW